MKYGVPESGVTFELPDKITVRQQLRFRSTIASAAGGGVFERFWEGAKTVITDWKSEKWPDIEAINIDESDDPELADMIQSVGNLTAVHMAELRNTPKNS